MTPLLNQAAVETLIAVATELAIHAKKNMPKLREGEIILHESYSNGVYRRETQFEGRIYLNEFDFKLPNPSGN